MKKVLLGILYWLVQLTWGIIMTVIGFLVTGFCILFLKGKVHKNGFSYIVEVGGDWGGLELGAVALCGGYTTKCPNENWFQHTRRHEFGHNIQNIVFGPLSIFLIFIPSAFRYWYRTLKYERKGLTPPTAYDDIWFEGQATKWGTWAVDKIENQ